MQFRTVFETDRGEQYEWEVTADSQEDAESRGRLKTVAMVPTRTIKTVEIEEL